MSKTHRYHDDDVLKDGDTLRVKMFSMDALDPVQRAIALTKQQFGDADGTALRRPGYRLLTGDAASAALDAVRQARQQYIDDLTNAWRDHQRKPDEDDGDGDDGNQEGAKSRRRKGQYRGPQGREAGTEEEFALR